MQKSQNYDSVQNKGPKTSRKHINKWFINTQLNVNFTLFTSNLKYQIWRVTTLIISYYRGGNLRFETTAVSLRRQLSIQGDSCRF